MSPVHDRRQTPDRRQSEQEWLDGVDKRRAEFRYGRRDLDQAPDPQPLPEQIAYEWRQEQARDARDGRDRYSV